MVRQLKKKKIQPVFHLFNHCLLNVHHVKTLPRGRGRRTGTTCALRFSARSFRPATGEVGETRRRGRSPPSRSIRSMPGCEWVDRRLSPLSPPADVTPEEQNGVLSLGPQSRVANALHRSPMQYLLSPHRGHLFHIPQKTLFPP